MRRPEPWRASPAWTLAVPILVLALIVACGGTDEAAPTEPPEPPVATTVSISPAAVDLSSLGETLQLTAAVADQNGQAMAGASVSWTTTDNSVASVSAGGLVTAVANGSATVTATSGSAAGTAAVTVAQRAARVDISPASVEFSSLGDSVQLTAAPFDANDNAVEDATVTWSSEDDAVATVDASGLVTAAGNGTANITAQADAASGAAAVTVSQVIVELDVVPPATTLFSLGDTIRLVASGVDANGHHGPALAVTWMSEHDAVATVDSNGLVTAVRTGSTDVFATTGELRDSAGVTVAQLATEVRVTPEADTLAIGDTLLLSAVALDGNGHVVEDTDYVWSTSNPAAVAVDDSGLVTALGPGTGTIRAQATRAGANYVGTATITVLASSAGGGRADP
ncbi:MAG: Ig-like domain-containing protein [Gammaproteobacteria bacterium]|nr:Ig-like domain-containing protein [Gammaproteobacteria bacterium]